MNCIDDLKYSFVEQCFIQIDSINDESEFHHSKETSQDIQTGQSYRLFRHNIFEPIDPQRKQYLNKLLLLTLQSIGQHISDHLDDSKRSCGPMLSPISGDVVVPARIPRAPILTVDRRKRTNFVYDKSGVIHMKPKEHVTFNSALLAKHALMLHVVAKVIRLIDDDTFITKRSLYYYAKDFCRVRRSNQLSQSSQTQSSTEAATQGASQRLPSQSRVSQVSSVASSASQSDGHRSNLDRYNPTRLNTVLDDLCCLVGCSRVHLHILSQPKGLVYGNLKFELKSGEKYDCLKSDGVLLPQPKSPIVHMESDAKFVLVLEKDSIFQKIIEQEKTTNFVERYKVIIFTAKGYPDITSRAFLHFLWTQLRIPILALTDADPHGMEIVCCYKFGCYTTAYEASNLALPQMRWLGLLPVDMHRLDIPESKTLPLTQLDIRKLNSLIGRPYLRTRSTWINQLNIMKTLGKKAELESIDNNGFYLTRAFLPNKLRYASWL